MRYFIICFGILYALNNMHAEAQVYINTSDTVSSALLEIRSTKKGVLLPRISELSINEMRSSNGLLMYNSDKNYFNYYSDSSLNVLNPWNYNTSNNDEMHIYFEETQVKVGIGTTDPKSTLEVNGNIKLTELVLDDVEIGTIIYNNFKLFVKTKAGWKKIEGIK